MIAAAVGAFDVVAAGLLAFVDAGVLGFIWPSRNINFLSKFLI